MSWRRVTCCALVVLVACAADAAAQAGLATLTVSVTLPDGATAIGARIEIAQAGPGALRTAVVDADHPIAVLPMTSGPHRIRVELAGYRTAEETQDLPPGSERRLAVRLAADGGMGRSTISLEQRSEPTYQTNLGSEWLTNLPEGRFSFNGEGYIDGTVTVDTTTGKIGWSVNQQVPSSSSWEE